MLKRISLFLFSSLHALTELGVTYDFSHGRFGDNLITYLHAKWYAYEHHLPLIYKPFQYSSHLVLSDRETNITEIDQSPKYRHYLDRGPVNPRHSQPILYICPYFPEDEWEQKNTLSLNRHTPWFYFPVNWEDNQFKQLIRTLIAPKEPLVTITPPPDRVSIAIHIREGGGHDDKFDIELGGTSNPMKFPPLSFYAQGLEKVLETIKDQPIYCYLFTDAEYPETLASKLRAHLPKELDIHFDYRKKLNRHHLNVLEDFFSLFNFDILIRSQSNFSLSASLIHDFAIVYRPKDCRIEGDRVLITDTELKIRPELIRW